VSSAGRTQDSCLESLARYLGSGPGRVSSGWLGLAIVRFWFWFRWLIPAQLTTCTYDVDRPLG
jgi:hypothetical protein